MTYAYQGLPLVSNFGPPLALGDSVAGYVTFAEAPTSGNFSAVDFLDYQFAIGAFHLSKANGAGASAQFKFDGAGAITSWSIVIIDYPYAPPPHLVEIWIMATIYKRADSPYPPFRRSLTPPSEIFAAY